MTSIDAPVTYTGGCHCGAVRFQVVVDPEPQEVVDCNCSICRKKGFLHLIVSQERFTLLRGSEALTTYTFNTGVAKHTFCRICGMHPFYTPRSHPEAVDVNVRCLDGDLVSHFRVQPFDGQNWEESADTLKPAR